MMTHPRPRRSVLYLPASNARAVDKARSLAADSIILDCEDSVAPDAKPDARREAVAAVRAGGFGDREVIVRVNGLTTPWGFDDLAAAALAGPDAILVPKVEDATTVMRASALLAEAGAPAQTALWVMMETPRALLSANEIAGAGGRLQALVIGSNDIMKELHARPRPDRLPQRTSLGLTLLAGRAYGLTVLDGVFNDIADSAGFEAECIDGRDMGFDGKTLIHPNQIEASNRLFAPDAAAVAEARRLIVAFEAPDAQGKGVIKIEGRMAERLHLEQARRLVAIADAIATRG